RRETFGEFQLLTVPDAAAVDAERRAIGEVRRLDDQRVAFEVPAWVAQERMHFRAEMRFRRQRDDARFVNHLVADRNEALALYELERVAVDDRQHRADDAAGDATVVQAAIVVRIGGAALAAGG